MPIVILIATLIVVNGLFVAAEFAIVGARISRLHQLAAAGSAAAERVQVVIRDRRKTDRYLATAQLGITLASLALGMVSEPVFARRIEQPLQTHFALDVAGVHAISFVAALALATYLHVVLGELVPKSLSLHSPERTAILLARPMALFALLLGPLVTILNRLGWAVLRVFHVPLSGEGASDLDPAELEIVVAESHEQGLLTDRQHQLVAGLLRFFDRRAIDVMTPRTRIEAIPFNISESELRQLVTRSTKSRLPVYAGSLDNIVGVIHVNELIRRQIEGQSLDLPALLRQVPFVPPTQKLSTLLAIFRAQRVHLAVVIDEFGGTLGLVSLADIVAEVMGENGASRGLPERSGLVEIAPGWLEVPGTMTLADLADQVPALAGEHAARTIGGLVQAKLGRLAAVGDEVYVQGVRIRVLAMRRRAIERVELRFGQTTEPQTISEGGG